METPGKVPHLGFPAAVIACEFMDKEQGGALACFFEVQALTVVGVDVGHGSIMFTSSGVLSCQAGDKPHSDQGSPRHLAMQASISMRRC
jgi:hypothetical protein